MQRQSGFAKINDTSLYYEVQGEGSPLILIHGFSLDNRMWEDQFEAFSTKHQVIRYDLRGFGRSILPAETPYAHHEDLKSLLTFLNIEQVTLVGLSLGAMVALDFTVSYPERVDMLIVADPVIGGYQWSAESDASLAPIWEFGRNGDINAAKNAWLTHETFTPALANPKSAGLLTQIIMEYSGWHFANHNPVLYLDPPAIKHLHTIHCPTLVIVGDADLADYKNIANLIHKTITGASYALVPNAGHMSNMEASERFNQLVKDFIE